MVDSIINDIKRTLSSGNMISRIILVNVCIYIAVNLVFVFDMGGSGGKQIYKAFVDWLSIPSDPNRLIRQPWSLFTHMFLHAGFWHLLWNMLMLYWFGRIIGDLLGDRRVLPIYILSGLFGGLVFICHDLFLPGGTGGMAYAMGASAAVMAIVWCAAMTSPDYSMHLLFLGPVKLKYIAIGLLFMDLIGSAGDINKGGHFAHMGGALWGMMYVYFLRRGTDLTEPFVGIMDRKKKKPVQYAKTPRSKFKIVHSARKSDSAETPASTSDHQQELDRILDKINDEGYEKLSDIEKDFLYRASKKK